MYRWEQRIGRLTRRAVRLFWWLFDLDAFWIVLATCLEGNVRESANSASKLLMIACFVLLWQQTENELARK